MYFHVLLINNQRNSNKNNYSQEHQKEKYLGINITKKTLLYIYNKCNKRTHKYNKRTYLHAENCKTAMKEIESDTNKWKSILAHGLEKCY